MLSPLWFQVSHSHAIAGNTTRLASKFSDRITEHFLPMKRQNTAYSVISSLAFFFFNEKGEKKETRFINTVTIPADSRYMRRGLVRYV